MSLEEELQEHSTCAKHVHVHCVNRFAHLHVAQAGSVCSDEHRINIDVNVIGHKIQALEGSSRARKLRVATWNFSGLCGERKQREIREVLAKNNVDVVAGRKS